MNHRMSAGMTTGKRVAVWALFTVAGVITVLGIALCAYGLLNNIEFTILQSSFPEAVFGAVITFLGIRYILSVRKLQVKLYAGNSQFSWSNFRK